MDTEISEISEISCPHINIDINENDYRESVINEILKVTRPHWPKELIKFKEFTEGITNKLIGCYLEDDADNVILVRIYGKNTELMIDRGLELSNIKKLQKTGFAPKLYASFNNGLSYEYRPGEILTTDTIRNVNIFPLVARTLAKLHSVMFDDGVECESVLWKRLEHYITLMPKSYRNDDIQIKFEKCFPEGIKYFKTEIDSLKKLINLENYKIVFCHNDLLLANIIHEDDHVNFIDYEYAGYNYQPFDIGNHFAEFAGVVDLNYSLFPSKEFQLEWLKIYLNEFNKFAKIDKAVTDADLEKLYDEVQKFVIASHLLWSLWALVQAEYSTIDFDFIGYANQRMIDYNKRKDDLLIHLKIKNDEKSSSF